MLDITTHPVYAAVAPMKSAALDKAEEVAREVVAEAIRTLAAADWNLDAVAPRGDARMDGKHRYRSKNMLRQFYSSLAAVDRKRYPNRHNDPYYLERDEARELKFIRERREAAGLSFDSYVVKLLGKVGDCDAAEVTGRLWLGSTLTVTKGAAVERWHTQQIINRSGLGTLFNQWPTRKQKPGRG